MPLTATSMYSRYKAKLLNCGVTFDDANQCYIMALLEAIADEIHIDARATGTDSGGDTHSLDID